MNTFSKLFLTALIAIIVLGACSRTKDAIGLDTIENFARTGQWKSVIQAVGNAELVEQDGYAEFKNDDYVHYTGSDGNQSLPSVGYSFKDTKTLVYGGIEYKIKENFVSTMKTITLVEPNTGTTVYTFYRERQ